MGIRILNGAFGQLARIMRAESWDLFQIHFKPEMLKALELYDETVVSTFTRLGLRTVVLLASYLVLVCITKLTDISESWMQVLIHKHTGLTIMWSQRKPSMIYAILKM